MQTIPAHQAHESRTIVARWVSACGRSEIDLTEAGPVTAEIALAELLEWSSGACAGGCPTNA